MNFEFRYLIAKDSKAYRKIRLESLKNFPDFFSANYEETLKTEKLSMEYEIEKQSYNKFVYGLFFDNKLIGICTFVKDDMNFGNIYQMYLEPEFQGKKLGQQLLVKTLQEARKRFEEIEIFLEVQVHNNKAKELYLKMGFVELRNEEESRSIIMKYFK